MLKYKNNINFLIKNEYSKFEYPNFINSGLSKKFKYYNYFNSSKILINESFPLFYYGYCKNKSLDNLSTSKLNKSQIEFIKTSNNFSDENLENIINTSFLEIENKFSLNKIVYELNLEILEGSASYTKTPLDDIKVKDFILLSIHKLFLHKNINLKFKNQNIKDFYLQFHSNIYAYEALLWDLHIDNIYNKMQLLYPILSLILNVPFILQKNNKVYPWIDLNLNLQNYNFDFDFKKIQDFFNFLKIDVEIENVYITQADYIKMYNKFFMNKIYKTKNILLENPLLFLEIELSLFNLKFLIQEILLKNKLNNLHNINNEIILNLIDRFPYLIYLNEIFGYLKILNLYGNFRIEYLLDNSMKNLLNILNFLNNKLYLIKKKSNILIFNIFNIFN
jgi:hypothetical protein